MSDNTNQMDPEIDPIVQDLLPGYIKSRRLEVFQLQRLLAENNFDKIRLIGHNLRGSGGLYGLNKISEIGQNIENGALVIDQDALGKAIQELQFFLNSLEP